MADWADCTSDIFKCNFWTSLKRLQVSTRAIETWAPTNHIKNNIAATKTKMKRSMLNIECKDRKTSVLVREKTSVIDVTGWVRRWKWNWAGQVSGTQDHWWTLVDTVYPTWTPHRGKQLRGGPGRQWGNKLPSAGQHKTHICRHLAEAFTQPQNITNAQHWWLWPHQAPVKGGSTF